MSRGQESSAHLVLTGGLYAVLAISIILTAELRLPEEINMDSRKRGYLQEIINMALHQLVSKPQIKEAAWSLKYVLCICRVFLKLSSSDLVERSINLEGENRSSNSYLATSEHCDLT